MGVLRHLDLILLALALPVFLAGGFSMLGYVTAAGAWLVQRGIQFWLARRIEATSDVRTSLGLSTVSSVGRGWFVALVILLVGLRDNEAGLASAILVIFLFSIYFLLELIMRAPGAPGTRP